MTLNVPNAFISIVSMNGVLGVGGAVARHGASAAHAAAGHVDHDRQRADGAGRRDGRADVVVVVDVAADGDDRFAELVGQRRAPVEVAVEDGDADAAVDELAYRGGAQAARSAGDDG